MTLYTGTLAANVRCYATISVEAEDEEAAFKLMQEAAETVDSGKWELGDAVCLDPFNADWQQLNEVEFLEDCTVDPAGISAL